MTRLAVIGVGSFGKNHVRVVRENSRAELGFVVDSDIARAREQAGPGVPATSDHQDVIGKVDAAILAVPTIGHAEIGCALLEAGIDVLVEKPIAPALAEADRLIDAAERNNRILQVGHLERFNPAVIALEEAATLPLFFEIHRMSVFTLRSLDVDVVLDLMIHDLDLVHALVKSPVAHVSAQSLTQYGPYADEIAAELSFADGTKARLDTSRIAETRKRGFRAVYADGVVEIDFLTRQVTNTTPRPLQPLEMGDPLGESVAAFVTAVQGGAEPLVQPEQAAQALETALLIEEAAEASMPAAARAAYARRAAMA